MGKLQSRFPNDVSTFIRWHIVFIVIKPIPGSDIDLVSTCSRGEVSSFMD